MVSEILDFLNNELFYGPFFILAKAIWQWCMALCTGMLTQTPERFSASAWEFTTETLYPWALGLGITLVNIFFLIGICRAASNLKENITLEICVESFIKLVVLNVLFYMGLYLIQTIFEMSAALSGQVMSFEEMNFYTSDSDVGSHLFWWLFGFAYFIVAVVCAIMILLTLYGRYIKLYVLIILFPFAMPALVGGKGVDSAAFAWIKTFLSNVLEIVVIALVMSITSRLIGGIPEPTLPAVEWFDGASQALHSIASMVLMTGAVKGAGSLLNRAFNL